MRLLRTLALLEIGAWAGMATAAAFVKRAVPSRGDEESDELALVAVFDGVDLRSRAKAFRGGSMLAWFGGVAVDLREAELAPDARLSVHTLFGGVAVRVPEGWRVESGMKAIAGASTCERRPRSSPTLPRSGWTGSRSSEESRSARRPPTRPPKALVRRATRFLLSLPERVLRALAAVTGGTVHETAELLLPRLVRRSRLYEATAKNLLRITVELIGGVARPSEHVAGEVEPSPGKLAVREQPGTSSRLGSIFAFGFSPLWLLAAAADVTHGTRVYLDALVGEAQGCRCRREGRRAAR